MLEYLKYFIFIYLGIYIFINLIFKGKVTIGLISWLHLINVKINLKDLKISTSSVSMQIRPMYYLHRKKIKATHHDGLIIIHFYKLKIDTQGLNSLATDNITESNSNLNKENHESRNKKICSTKTILKLLQWLRWILPLTIVIHNFSVVNEDKWLNIETFSLSFNCDIVTDKLTKDRLLRNTLHFNISNFHDKNRKYVKDLKWTLIASIPLANICAPTISKLVSSCVVHGYNVNIDKLTEIVHDIIPQKKIDKSIIKPVEVEITNSQDKIEKFKKYFNNFNKSDIYFAFDDSIIEKDNYKACIKNMVYSINTTTKKDISFAKYSGTKLFKVTLNFSGLKIYSNLLQDSRLQIEFLNFFSILDINSIIYSIKNINNADIIKQFTYDDSFIARNFLTVTNTTLFTTLDDVIEFNKLKKQTSLQKSTKKIDKQKHSLTNNNLIENLLRLTHKLRTRAQFLTTMVQLNFTNNFSTHLLIDDILLDSSLTDNVASLFETEIAFTPTKSIFISIRNVQLSITDNSILHKIFIIDLFDYSLSVGVSDDKVTIDDVTFYIHHIEFLAENVEIFQKLCEISTGIINKESPVEESNDKLDHIEDTDYNEADQENEYDDEFLLNRPTVIPRFIQSVKFTIRRITATACFQNPVKYWDNEDQTELNNYKRGISICLKEFEYLHDNTDEIPIADFKLDDIVVSLVRDYGTEKQKQKFLKIFNLKKLHAKYSYMNHKFSMVLPIIDITLSVEVLWTFFFIKTILLSVKGRKNLNTEANTKLEIPKSKKAKKHNLQTTISVPLLMLNLKLPSDVELALEVDSFQYRNSPVECNNKRIEFEVFRIYGQNPHASHMWTLLAIISQGVFDINGNDVISKEEEKVSVVCNDIRIEIPYEYIFYKVFDNLKAFFKSIKKLKHNFSDLMYIDDSNKEFKVDVIMPSIVEKPPRLPHIKIKSKRILYCNHDDPFEEELTGFLMLGKMEQYVRASKLKAFEKYEANILKNLQEKYQGILKFENGTVLMPESVKRGVQDNAYLSPESHGMRKSFSTSFISSSNYHRKRENTVSIASPSKLSNEIPSDDVEAWLNYKRDYHTAIEIPRNRLNANISKSWITRVRASTKIKSRLRAHHSSFTADPKVRKEFLKKFPVVVEGNLQPLFDFTVSDAILDLNEPNFGLENYPDFMHKVASGMPKDMKYGILFPMNLNLSCSEAVVQIKDYPLPLIGFGGAPDDNCLSVKFSGDMIICEQAYVSEEIRYNFVPCVPQYNDLRKKDCLYAFHIARTMTNVKFVTDMDVFVNSSRASSVSWSPSLQPGLSYALNSFDLLSKPPLDISSKIGFWDKMPLLVPSRFTFHLKKGIVLFIKSSHSPYHLIGRNSGFAFKWGDDAVLKINSTGKSEDFMIVQSDVFEIGVPVFDPHYVSDIITTGIGNLLDYKTAKILLKLTSKPIIWKLGLLFERNFNNERNAKPGSVERTRIFRPHYDIKLRNPDTFSNEQEKEDWDSYMGWRSDYIFLNLSVYSRDDNKCKEIHTAPLGSAFNTLYLTPMTLYYFFYWWNTFKSSLGLPIKTGKLFKNKFLSAQKSPKFSASLFGLSYLVDLSPLYLTHVYQHTSSGHDGSKVAFTGLKCFVKSFTMDLHQSKREVTILDEHTKTVSKEYHLKMDKGIIDFVEADLRILTAVFNQTSTTGILAKQLGLDKTTTTFSETDTTSSGSEDYLDRVWYDKNDFVELEAQLIPDEDPKWKVYEFTSSPRFYYVRDNPSTHVDYPFDFIESQTHQCQLSQRDFSGAAANLAITRLTEIEDQISFYKSEFSDISSKPKNEYTEKRLEELNSHIQELHHRLHILRCLKDKFNEGIFPEYDEFIGDEEESDDEAVYDQLSKIVSRISSHISRTKSKISTAPIRASNYRNRFSVYAINVKWTPHVRSGFLRYLENVKNRRFLEFSLSQKALNLAEDLNDSFTREPKSETDFSFLESDPQVEFEKSRDLLDDFDQVLHDTVGFLESETDDTYLLKLILPQIAITTSNNNCAILASNQIVLRRVTVTGFGIDGSEDNEITLPTETRDGITITDAFVYVLNKENVLTNKLRLYNTKSYSWPPRLPIEMYYTPISLDKYVVVQDLSCAILFIKPNQYHYSKKDASQKVRCKETVRVVAPDVIVTTDQDQYATLYEIFTTLNNKDETEIQRVKEAVKNLVKYSDFSDFKDLYHDLSELQSEARQLQECRRLMVNVNFADTIDVVEDIEKINIELEKVLLNVNAIVDILQTSKTKVLDEFHEFIQWNIMAATVKLQFVDENGEPFVELNAIDGYYMFTESPQGESINTAYIYDFVIYDKYDKSDYDTVATRLHDTNESMFRIDWTLLAPVGGIKIVKDKIFQLAPTKVEFDMKFAEALQEFLFPKSKILQTNTLDFEENQDLENDLFDLDSRSSDGTSNLLRVNSISSQISLDSNEKESGSKISRAFHKLLPKHNSSKSKQQTADKPSIHKRNSSLYSISNLKENSNDSCSNNIQKMESRASKYYMVKHVRLNEMNLSITFKGVGKLRFINLTDFKIKTPCIDITNRIMSNEELFAILRNKLVKFVLKNTHNVIKSTLKSNKSSKSSSNSSTIAKKQAKDSITIGDTTTHITNSKIHGHKHHEKGLKFHDTDLLEPRLENVETALPRKLISLSELAKQDNIDIPVDDTSIFQQLDDVQEEDEDV